MRAAFSERLQELPSYLRKVRRFRDCLSEGRSLVVALPEPHEQDDLWAALREQLHLRDLITDALDLDQVDGSKEPFGTLAEFVALPDPHPGRQAGVQDLLRSENVPDILALIGLDNLSQRDQRAWMSLIEAWSQASQGLAGEVTRKSLFVPLSTGRLQVPMPHADVRLRVDYWLGTPTTEELQYLARYDGGTDPPPERLWRETMVLAFAGEDARLAELLLTTPMSTPDWPSPTLRDYASRRGWSNGHPPKEVLHILADLRQKSVTASTIQDIPSAARGPWSRGLLYWTPWSGWELHSAWLALHGPEHLLGHRLCQAQASLVLPLVDRLRLGICSWLSQHYGEDWPFRWTYPKAPQEMEKVDDNPYACQWGHLTRILNEPELSPLRDLRQTARLARDIRNELSHQRCIRLAEFRALWKGYHQGLAMLAAGGEGIAV
jgi:hypothetical protein